METYVVQAVHEFFTQKRLYAVVNCALVTLFPKTKEAKTMKELSSIACFSTLYKVISNILTRRLSKVIGEVVDESYSTFISDRNIQYNIIISH